MLCYFCITNVIKVTELYKVDAFVYTPLPAQYLLFCLYIGSLLLKHVAGTAVPCAQSRPTEVDKKTESQLTGLLASHLIGER